MKRGFKVFLAIVLLYAVFNIAMVNMVPAYAARLMDSGVTVEQLSSMQKYLIATGNVMKNQGLFLFPLVIVVAAIVGGVVNRFDKSKGRKPQLEPAP